jgi:hypothetical protein
MSNSVQANSQKAIYDVVPGELSDLARGGKPEHEQAPD